MITMITKTTMITIILISTIMIIINSRILKDSQFNTMLLRARVCDNNDINSNINNNNNDNDKSYNNYSIMMMIIKPASKQHSKYKKYIY